MYMMGHIQGKIMKEWKLLLRLKGELREKNVTYAENSKACSSNYFLNIQFYFEKSIPQLYSHKH